MLTVPLEKKFGKKYPLMKKQQILRTEFGEKKLSQKDTKLYMSLVLAFTISMEFIKI